MVSGFLYDYLDLQKFLIWNHTKNLIDTQYPSSSTDMKNLNNYTNLCLHKSLCHSRDWQRPMDKKWGRSEGDYQWSSSESVSNVTCNIGQERLLSFPLKHWNLALPSFYLWMEVLTDFIWSRERLHLQRDLPWQVILSRVSLCRVSSTVFTSVIPH
jgi:hypothetical protein